MTDQEVFDKVVLGVRKQGKPSIGVDGMCRFRGAKGTKCAAGMLIPDEKYDPKMDRCGAAWKVRRAFPDACEWTGEQGDLVSALQSAHDDFTSCDIDFMTSFILRVNRVAEKFNLDPSACTKPL